MTLPCALWPAQFHVVDVHDASSDGGGGAYHHIGIQTDDLAALYARLKANDVKFRSDIREFGNWRYVMCPAPDDVLLELFQIDVDAMPTELAQFFTP